MFKDPTKARNWIHERMPPKDCGRKAACRDRLLVAIHYLLRRYEDPRSNALVTCVACIMDAYWYANATFEVDVVPGESKLTGDPAIVAAVDLLGTMAQATEDGRNWGAHGIDKMGREVLFLIDRLIEKDGGDMRTMVMEALS